MDLHKNVDRARSASPINEQVPQSILQSHFFNEEISAHIFGIAPSDMSIEIKQNIVDIFLSCLSTVNNEIIKRCSEDSQEIKSLSNQLTKKWLLDLEPKFRVIDGILKECFRVSVNNVSNGTVESNVFDEAKLDEEIEQLAMRYKSLTYTEQKLKQELTDGREVCSEISDILIRCESALKVLTLSESDKQILRTNSKLLYQLNEAKKQLDKLTAETSTEHETEK